MPFVAKLLVVIGLVASLGAKHATNNFVVEASSPELAQQVAQAAEHHRAQLALAWFGHPIKDWFEPCKVTVQAGPKLGAGGKTKFKFDQGNVYGWDMFVQGSVERILDSVIPHEVNHTILACYFRRPVPRWADEGAASLFEHESEVGKQQDLVNQLIQGGRRIPLRMLLGMKEYPTDMQQTLALYAEGYSLTNYLVQAKGRATFLRFLNDAHHQGWDAALKSFYDKKSVEALDSEWCSWIMAGSPRLSLPQGQLVAKQPAGNRPSSNTNTQVLAALPMQSGTKAARSADQAVRGQSPDAATALRQLRQQIRDEQPLPPAQELAAPDPRVNAPKVVSKLPPRPVSSEPKSTAVTKHDSDELRPIELIRIDERATEAPSAQRLFRETRLHSDLPVKPTEDRLRPWAQFPSRSR